MFKRVSVLIGTVLFALVVLSGLIWAASTYAVTHSSADQTGPLGVLQASLVVTKTGDLHARIGDDVVYPITVCNTGHVTLSKVLVVDSLIPGVDGDYAPSLFPQACETHTFTRTVQPADPHPWLTNTVTATYQVQGSASIVITVTASHAVRLTSPGLAITKTGDSRARVGDDVTYPITVCNASGVTLTRLSIVDSLIPGVDGHYNPSLPPATCETHTFTRTVRLTDLHPLINVVTATYQVLGGPDVLVATDTHAVDLLVADLAITKSARPRSGPSGAPITFTITFTNNGPFTATDVIISDWLPDDTHYISGTGSLVYGTGSLNLLAWRLPVLPPSSTYSFDLHLNYDGPLCQGTLTNTVAITSTTTPDPNPHNNRATATYQLLPSVNLAIAKHDGMGPHATLGRAAVRPGERLTYTIAYTNQGPCAATNVVLTETLPQDSAYVGSGWTRIGERAYIQAVGDLQPGQSSSTTLIIQLHDPELFPLGVDLLTNTVRISAGGSGIGPTGAVDVITTPLRTDLKLYIANRDLGTLDVFNTTAFEYLWTIPLTATNGHPASPFGMAISGTRLFVVGFGEGTDLDTRSSLYVVDTENDAVVDMVPIGRHAIHVAVYQDRVYVANHSASFEGITIINANPPYDVVERLECTRDGRCFDYGFFGITVDERRGRLYATKRDNDYCGIWTLTPSADGAELDLVETRGEHPSSIVYNPHDDRVYVTFGLIDQLWVYNPGNGMALVNKIETGLQDPVDPGYGGHGLIAVGRCVFVSNYRGESLTTIVNGDCVSTPGTGSARLTLKSSSQVLYLPVMSKNSNALFRAPTALIPLGGRPMGLTAAGNYLFVTLPEDGDGRPLNRIAVVDLRTMRVVREITVRDGRPHFVILARGNTDEAARQGYDDGD
jgi:uncharacterized repeat protein (TIGR01451 family)